MINDQSFGSRPRSRVTGQGQESQVRGQESVFMGQWSRVMIRGHGQGHWSGVTGQWSKTGQRSLDRGHWSESRVSGQRSLVKGQ